MSNKNKESKWAPKPKIEAPEVSAPMPEKIDFDSWWALVSAKIPAMHHREIVKADMVGRGMTDSETFEDFSAALKKYGIELK